jgi:hypothetical protein
VSGTVRDRWARWLLERRFGGDPGPRTDWNTFLRSAGNPNIPTLEEVMNEALTPQEIERFTAHLRPQVENARRRGTMALAYLRAVK